MTVRRFTLASGLLLGFVGAVLLFALEDPDDTIIGLELQPLGGVLLGFGVLLTLAATIGSLQSHSSGHTGGGGGVDAIRQMGGLIAVVSALITVMVLAVFTVSRLAGDEHEALLAVTSSAFGIVSAIVGAYLGIKITADTDRNSATDGKLVAAAEEQAEIKERQLSAALETARRVGRARDAEAIGAAVQMAGQEGGRTARPSGGNR